MLKNKNFLIILIFLKFVIIFNTEPILEISRYTDFFEQCVNLTTCINPYSEISSLGNSYLTFPYGNFMYFSLLPFYIFSKLLGTSFVILSYLFFEILLITFLKKIYNLSELSISFLLVLNPLIIFSVSNLGQLDFIPLTYSIIALYYLKERNKALSLFWLLVAVSTKISFSILVPIFVLYFVSHDLSFSRYLRTILGSTLFLFFINFQLFFDENYRNSILYGIDRSVDFINQGSFLRLNNTLYLLIFITFLLLIYWKNLYRLDFVGVCLFIGFLTLPIFILNISNIGWLLWSFPMFILVFHSYGLKIKFLVYLFFSLLVFINQNNELFTLSSLTIDVLNYFIYILGLLFIFYSIQILFKNIYFKIKSKPIILSIAGDSAVGKTTITNVLINCFGVKKSNKIELDSFHKFERDDPQWKLNTHLNPDMNNLLEFKNSFFNIISGKTEIIKKYNHFSGKFDSASKKRIRDFLIVEGLHSLFFDDLNEIFDLKLFLDLDDELKKETKISRDLERNKELNKILDEINLRKKDFIEYILPQREFADIGIVTITRSQDNVFLNIQMKKSYFYEFESLVKNVLKININKDNSNTNFINFNINTTKKTSKSMYSLVTKDIQNLIVQEFNIDKQNIEIITKLTLILFVLQKKLQIRI